MVKLTREDAEKMPQTGKMGILREMILAELGWRSKNQLFDFFQKRTHAGKSWKTLSKVLKSLKEAGYVEHNYRLKKTPIYRPDAFEDVLDKFRVFNVTEDFRTFLKEVRHRFRLTCLCCGYSQNKLLRQALRFRCPECGSFNIRVEYPKLFDSHKNSEDQIFEDLATTLPPTSVPVKTY